MRFLDWLRGKRRKGPAVAGRGYTERDNRGTRHDTLKEASTWWMLNLANDKGGFAVYTFSNERDARAAMLDLDFIHQTKVSGRLICDEPIIFGVYSRDDGVWEAEIAGKSVTRSMWSAACAAFEKHGGKRKGVSDQPAESAPRKEPRPDGNSKVAFVREDRKRSLTGQTMIYKIYKGPNAAAAKAFLTDNPVNKPLLYFVVETPEGTYCRDVQGMYQE